MLVSHRKKFIFTKTMKTAGTSVESYFEPHCFPPGQWQASENREVYESETGVVGYRGPQVKTADRKWYNHMSAQKIRDQLPRQVWDQYFKFTVIRNPYDKLVSGFYWYNHLRPADTWSRRVGVAARKLIGRAKPIDCAEGKTDIERFRSWLRAGGSVSDQSVFLIDGKCCVDFFIRYEHLHEDIQEACHRIGIEPTVENLPQMKSGIRSKAYKTSDYYDAASIRIVKQRYAFEIERFGYEPPR
jgi:hypothetical protein